MTVGLFSNFLRPNKPKATVTGGDPKSTTISEPHHGLISFFSLPAISPPCLHCTLNSFPMVDQRTLRGISVASFLPAFILCIFAGSETGNAVPAVGIVPHFFSSILGVAILVSLRKQQPKWIQASQVSPRGGDDEAHLDADSLLDNDEPRLKHSFLVFLADVILATALIVVLVVTWTENHHRYYRGWADHIMLLTYATVPLMLNASIHIILALQEFVDGTGLARVNFRRALQRLCLLPQDCPHCGNHLHAGTRGDDAEAPLFAAGPPSWFRGMSGSGGRIKLPVAGVPAAVGWSAPPWMGQRGSKVVGEGQETGDGERYRDGEGVGGEDVGVGGKGKGVAGEGEAV
ncbi:hypothetical protein B0T18DRAFT_443127 [Schizothecium vesticola]|uniref:Uncharacterized protein n=1 Tax=Schizothecium vesticola TaxID=314040 RepID=A0AA40KD61_9PEZI|nr:hypothetical protein B0T18DRAFT_443127 [Schizothecium vesticola]